MLVPILVLQSSDSFHYIFGRDFWVCSCICRLLWGWLLTFWQAFISFCQALICAIISWPAFICFRLASVLIEVHLLLHGIHFGQQEFQYLFHFCKVVIQLSTAVFRPPVQSNRLVNPISLLTQVITIFRVTRWGLIGNWIIEHLQNETTNNCNGLTELHTSKISVTIAHMKYSQSSLAIAQHRLPTADDPLALGSRTVLGLSYSNSWLTDWLTDCRLALFITSWHGPHSKHIPLLLFMGCCLVTAIL
jgi:hypothetical protein